ncbi:MAG: hypothetical protein LBC77_01175 [Spirochaetaceae bacterium]|jgi:hypothetical protein|nr:hypothetical protein [Spirochaetaceae bacterium]
MVNFLREIQSFNTNDWVWLMFILAIFFAGVSVIVFVVFKSLKQLKLYVGKDGIKINDTANTKLDCIIERLIKLERDVVALQIMNEHITPCERLKLYDYYKRDLHGNSFIDEYIEAIKANIDRTRFS